MRKDLLLIAIIVATLTLMVIPLSQDIIDVLLALNISISVLLLMVALYLKHPSDFSTFPSVILIGTAFRLALSVGTTRLILSEADAGQIIETFGDFVVSGSVAIGLVIFLIITVVQFLVVTKGAERVAEVGARFALDALPGKQLSIDAELRAGNLEADEATAMRQRLDKDSQFFGAMDGAMKFVKGDAIAGLIIICINLLGGIAVGMSLHGYGFGEAVGVFSLLTVGDGLVAQIPALLMSLCAGIIVTRAAGKDNDDLGTDISKELVSDPRVPSVAAMVVLAIGFIPGFPTMVFTVMSMVLVIAAVLLRRRLAAIEPDGTEALDGEIELQDDPGSAAATDEVSLSVSDRFKLILSEDAAETLDLASLERQLSDAFQRLTATRGVPFPRAAVTTSSIIGGTGFIIELDEVPIFQNSLEPDCILVQGGNDVPRLLNRDPASVVDVDWPSFHGVWVADAFKSELEGLGVEVESVEPVLARLTFRLYERNLGTLFSQAVFSEVVEHARLAEPGPMEEVEAKLARPALYQVLRYLIEDGIPIRPIGLLVTSLHYWLHADNNNPTPVILAECLRGAMKRQLCFRISGPDRILGVALLDPSIETLARQGLAQAKRTETNSVVNDGLIFEPEVNDELLTQFRALIPSEGEGGRHIAIVAAADLRRRFRNYLASHNLHMSVLAPHELSSEITTYPVEVIKLERTRRRVSGDLKKSA
ncbi:FHIPEP family type III secretion protein [Aestuariibius insulae]|uniref:FHIPEP family type III secretion protein n=1 Tax=Aestuariibius insulae TaxID=2058287 RepID=UPI00345E5A4E